MMGSSCLCLPQVDYTTVFVFRLLMFVDNGLASGMGLDLGWQQRYARFCGRIVVLSILALLLYPFLWAWTVIGTLWFTSARNCLPEEGQKWGFLIWLLFSYCGLVCIAGICIRKWLIRRQAHQLRAQQGIPVSEYGVFVDLVRVPDWAFEAAGQEMRGMGLDAAQYQPGLYLTPAQREAVEALIQELPKFRLKAVPTDCSECPICLEEFYVGNEVRGLPCAHNFHVECIDEWLRLNVKCPRCRCSVFPNLDLSALSTIRADSERSTNVVTTTGRYIRNQPPMLGPAAKWVVQKRLQVEGRWQMIWRLFKWWSKSLCHRKPELFFVVSDSKQPGIREGNLNLVFSGPKA
ncbi:UNVERIFIED_CONTAM: E3 ubiquitin-protein ligase SIS3 [Sesamum indicum]